MDIRKVNSYWVLLLLPFLMGCPWGDEKCFNDWEQTTRIPDMLTITPLKDTFKQGEVIVFELIIPDSISFQDRMVSLYSETGDTLPRLVTHSELFNENPLDFKYGFQGEAKNWFHLEYIAEDGGYILKVFVQLDRTGSYGIAGRTNDTTFKGEDRCNFYRVTTNIKGHQRGGSLIEFVVIE